MSGETGTPRESVAQSHSQTKYRKLRSLTHDDLRIVFNCPDISKEWTECSPKLSELCQIKDGKTGAINPGDRRALFYLARAFRPAKVLEIATHVGASTMHLATALARGARSRPPRLVTVDIEDVNGSAGSVWKQTESAKSPKQMIDELNSTI
jgi:hypothetical protein